MGADFKLTNSYDPVGNVNNVKNSNNLSGSSMNLMNNLLGRFAPDQNIANLQGVTPGVQSVVQGATDPYSYNSQNLAQLLANSGVQNAANQYSSQGALNSGAAVTAMAQGAANPYSQSASNIANLQGNMGSGLLGQYMNQMGGIYNGSLQGQAQYGAPEWWQPSYQESPGLLQGILGGGMSGALTGASVGGGWGALVGGVAGAGLGALSSGKKKG
jgi:hypothetical protein